MGTCSHQSVSGVPQVKNYARIADSIIGWGGSVGKWARIENKSVIGEDVHVKVCGLALCAWFPCVQCPSVLACTPFTSNWSSP